MIFPAQIKVHTVNPPGTPLPPLTVNATDILQRGNVFKIHGVNLCSLEWSVTGDHILQSVDVAKAWGANFIRVPLSQDRWFGHSSDSTDDGTKYRALVDQVVKKAIYDRMYILLDLHWSDMNQWGQNIGQHQMPDQNSVTFWSSCAKHYRYMGNVLFDLYNEPFGTNWTIWQNGGSITENFQGHTVTYNAVGMQDLLDAVRATGARNLVVAGGLGYSSETDAELNYRLNDPKGNGVVYANHFYPGWETIPHWLNRMASVDGKAPFIVSEYGGDYGTIPLDDPANIMTTLINTLQTKNWNWSAWCMHTAATPCLISDWNYTPTTYFGTFVKQALAGQTVSIQPAGPSTDHWVYDDQLESGFQSWGNAAINFSNSSPVASGSHSIAVNFGGYQTMMLGDIPFDGSRYSAITFQVNGNYADLQKLQLQCGNELDQSIGSGVSIPVNNVSGWQTVTIPFSQLGIGTSHIKTFTFQNKSGSALGPIYFDNIKILH